MNVECRRNVLYLFIKKIERSETILRNSAVRYSTVLRFAVLACFALCLYAFVTIFPVYPG